MAFNPLLIGAIAIGATLIYASALDLRTRRVPFRTWYPMVIIGTPCTLWFYLLRLGEDPSSAITLVVLSAVFASAFYLFGRFGLIGGADAWALVFITLLMPAFPATPLLGDTAPGFFPFPLLIHAEVVALLAPLAVLLRNRRRGVEGPLLARLRGYPVPADEITEGNAFGFLMEDLSVEDGELRRRFYTLGESIRAIFSDTRIYTRELRVEPERFAEEIALIRRASPVWIAIGVPFIVPLTIGFFVTLIVGDTLFYLLSALLGG
jgi:preflagellin peptidase FlaK